jgi:hypothetical protein
LNDNGLSGDGVERDKVFTKKIPEQKFGFYRIIIEATDSFGNSTREEVADQFVQY